MEFLKTLLKDHFFEFYLALLFVIGAVVLVLWGNKPEVADWVEKGVVIGAILGLITGAKKQNSGGEK